MLSQLYIKNVAVISEAAIDFGPEFNIFTGETGAGKTILISAINGVLGARLNKDIIRSGEDRAILSALFTHLQPAVLKLVEEAGYEAEDGNLLITRELGVKNFCRINGRPATLQILREIASALIDIHGQKDNHRLLLPENHIEYIDQFGELSIALHRYQDFYRQAVEIKRKIDQVSSHDREKEHQIDLLNYQIKEIEAAELEPGEEEQLQIRREQIKNSEKIAQMIAESKSLLDGSDDTEGLQALFGFLCSNLNALSRFLPELEETAHKFEEFHYDLADLGSDITGYLEEIDFQVDELERVEDRLDTIYKLKRKYGSSIQEILSFLAQCQSKLGEIVYSEEKLQKLQQQYHLLLPRLQAAADELTSRRHKAARDFLSRVKKELEFLNMPSVKLTVSAGRSGLKVNGQDDMEFLISSNAGEEPKPLAKIASGGELSRVMLSIKNVLAEKDQVGTAIFDEIDTGVSGKTAQKIGQKLKEVSKNRQVICVTHLPQVAAFADHHLRISKEEQNGRTYTKIEPLDQKSQVLEIARMISGEYITETAISNAQEMIELTRTTM